MKAITKSLAVASVAGFLLGTAAATSAQEIRSADASAQLLVQARAIAALAAQNVDASRQAERISRVRYDAGTAAFTEWLESNLALIEAGADLNVAELDVEEIEIGGGPVRTEISAPLVAGRDYVSKRLQIELDTISAREATLAEGIRVIEAEVEAGVKSAADLRPLTMDRARLTSDAERVRETMALRQSFLIGDIDASEAEQRLRMLRATSRQQAADTALWILRAADGPLRERYAAGTASENELLGITREIQLVEAEALAARIEIVSIEQEISR